MAFDSSGGRRTIGGREQALDEWSDRVEAAKGRSHLLTVKPSDMGDMAHHAPGGGIWMPKEQIDLFFNEQKKGESNGQTLARLIRGGQWKVGKLSSQG